MRVVKDIGEMQSLADSFRREGKVIAFVPTMGYFHQGHLRLFEEGRRRGDVLVVSLFVNPIQFGQGEDYATYPRDLERDMRMAGEAGVDLLFTPSEEDMYPEGFQTYVTVEEVTRNLCGAFRPNHFRGVATVVTKLFHIVKPHVAIFGEKDYQQLVTIRRMVGDLNMDIEIVGVPTVREEDGLAVSSRNAYLSPEERRVASLLFRALKEGERLYSEGERDGGRIARAVREILEREPLIRVEYVKVCDPERLEDVRTVEGRALLALAARIGRARLIDSIILGDRATGHRKGAV